MKTFAQHIAESQQERDQRISHLIMEDDQLNEEVISGVLGLVVGSILASRGIWNAGKKAGQRMGVEPDDAGNYGPFQDQSDAKEAINILKDFVSGMASSKQVFTDRDRAYIKSEVKTAIKKINDWIRKSK